MKKVLKSICSVVLVVIMVFNLFSVVPTALAMSNARDELYLNTPVDVTVTGEAGENPSSYFYFVPQESGIYFFYSQGSVDTYGYVYDEEYQTYYSDDDSGDEYNFKIAAELTAGQTYILETSSYSYEYASFTVVVEKSNISSIVFNDTYVIEGTGNIVNDYVYDTDEYVEWVEYSDYRNIASGIITFDDGTTANIENGYYVDGDYQEIQYSDAQCYYNQWILGDSYEVTATLFGVKTTFLVEVIESPVASITAEPISIMEGINGDYGVGGDYYYYYVNADNTLVTVTLEDGTVIDNCDEYGNYDSYIYYDGFTFYIDALIEQSEENPLLPGNTYNATVSVLGATCNLPVTILEAPKAVSVTATPRTIMEFTNGQHWGDYYHYYIYADNTLVTVTLEDGTVLDNYNDEWNYYDSYIYYDGFTFYIDVLTEQSAENPWLPGNTYNATVSVLGATCNLPVTILEAPKAVSVTATPITIMEGTNGDYDDWGDYYYYYINANNTLVTVTLEDGTVLDNYDDGGDYYSSAIYYDGFTFYIDVLIEQSAENPWLPGNTYNATVSVLGATCDLPVTILEAPKAVSVTATPITIMGFTNGNYDDWGDYYYYYIDADDTLVTVTLEDGTVLDNYNEYGNYDSYIYYDGFTFYIDALIEQSEENPLLPGNTYNATVSVLGATCDLPVTITESPVKSIEVLRVKPVYTIDYVGISDGNFIYSIPDFNFKVNFENGKYIILDHREWGSKNGNCSHNQYEIPWTVGGENVVTLSYMGASTQFNVELLEKDADFNYEVQDGVAYITRCNTISENLVIPSEIDGYTVKGILSLNLDTVKELTIPDSVIYFSSLGYSETLEVINIGSGVEELCSWHFDALKNLKEINVSANNKNYASIDGVLYNKTLDKIVFYPIAKGNAFVVPSTVTDFSILFSDIYADLNIELESGNDVYVTVDGVTYSSDMKNLISCNPEKTGEYVMPDTVISITKGAFANSNLEKITVSSGVTEIVYDVFRDTLNLETVILPQNLKKIDSYAFNNSAISSISLPNSLQEIGCDAFANTKLTKIEIPGSVKNISSGSFAGIDVLSEININEGVETIGNGAFLGSGNKAIVLQLHLPNTLKTIEEWAFSNTNITEITLPTGVSLIGDYAFVGCSQLKTVNINGDNVIIGDSSFSDCPQLKTVDFNGEKITVGPGAFYNTPIENFDFEKVSGAIWQESFQNSNLTSIVFPETVTDISYRAFKNSSKLEDVDFPETIITLDPEAFEGTPWYEDVYSELDDGWVIYDNIFLGYKGDFANVKNTAPVLPEGVTSIVSDSMQYATFSSIELPNSLKIIGVGAFQYNKNLSSIYIPENVSYIAESAFYNCSSLSDIKVAENNPYYTAKNGVLYNKDMTKLIFCGKQNTEVFRVPSTVKEIVNYAFQSSGVKYLIFENCDVTTVECYPYESDKMTVSQEIDGVEFEFSPTLIFDKSVDSKIKDIAENKLYHTIDINDLTVNSIGLAGDYKTTYDVGEKFDCAGMKLEVNYGEFSELIDVTPEMVSGFDSSSVGTKKVIITYQGFKTILNVTVSKLEHIYDDICDEDCNICGRIRTDAHIYGSECDRDCNVCGKFRRAPHKYDNACDYSCNLCDVERDVDDHQYSGNCDATCNECGFTRAKTTNHVYGEMCDIDCNVCGAIRKVVHVFTNECDNECDICYETRRAPHKYDSDCDTNCNECGKKRTGSDHTYTNAYDSTCNECGYARTTVGDIDGDLKVTLYDLIALAQYTAGWNIEVNVAALDVNGDGEVTLEDTTHLSRYLAGWDVKLF